LWLPVAASSRLVQRLFRSRRSTACPSAAIRLSTAVACVLRHRMPLSRSEHSSSPTSGDRGGRRWAPPPAHLGLLSSTCYADQPSCVSSLRTGYIIEAILMRAKRGERAACAASAEYLTQSERPTAVYAVVPRGQTRLELTLVCVSVFGTHGHNLSPSVCLF
jgi:hypothetical protein